MKASPQLETEGVTLLGIADVDPDNYADLCVAIADPAPSRLFVKMRCGSGLSSIVRSPTSSEDAEEDSDSGIVFGPSGNPCSPQFVVVKSKYKDNNYD